MFVTANGDIYSYDSSNTQVNVWPLRNMSNHPVMFVSSHCRDLFIDTNNTLYCSMSELQQVVAKSLNDPMNTLRTVAGTGCSGSALDMLAYPRGIFVDLSFSLFVADSGNNRIQRFNPGQLNASTVAGNGVSGSITLSAPIGIVLDGHGYLFIVDCNNHRIIGSGPNGFRCVAGCMNSSGSASNQLSYPQSISFDSNGNIWVADTSNARIQKFVLKNNAGGKCCPVVSVRLLSGDELSSNKSAFIHELSPHWHLYVDMTVIESFSC